MERNDGSCYDASQRGSFELAFWLSDPPAEPVATVFASEGPVCIVAQPDKPRTKPSAVALTNFLFFMEQPFQNGNGIETTRLTKKFTAKAQALVPAEVSVASRIGSMSNQFR